MPRLLALISGKVLFSEIVLGTDLAGDGTVVFTANFREGGRQAILLGVGDEPFELTNNLGPWDAVQTAPFINTNGLVSFRATLDGGGQGIFVNRAGKDEWRFWTNELYSDFAGGVPINDAGTIVVVANLLGGGSSSS